MKIGILTHYNVASHGALLQLYAMVKQLEQLGHDPYVLTYKKNFDYASSDDSKKFQVGASSIPYYLRKYLVQTGLANGVFQVGKQRELKDFGKRYFKYADYAQGGMDAVVIGADEVFSLQYGLNFMMYGHGIDAKNVFAYAPSFGQTGVAQIDEHHARALIASGIGSLSGVSVRDEGSREIVKELCDIEPTIVCDPALLYDFASEKRDLPPAKMDKPFALVYAYTTNMNEKATVDEVRNYAQSKDLELVSIEGYHAWCDKNVNCGPLEMLGLFADAQAVITDTFHGTISSVITHAPMAIYTRPTNTVKLGYLVEQLGLDDRLVGGGNLADVLSDVIDYDPIDRKVEQLRTQGLAYLEEQLSKCMEEDDGR